MAVSEHMTLTRLSLPVRGAWVEIYFPLKREKEDNVAPRAGSVG